MANLEASVNFPTVFVRCCTKWPSDCIMKRNYKEYFSDFMNGVSKWPRPGSSTQHWIPLTRIRISFTLWMWSPRCDEGTFWLLRNSFSILRNRAISYLIVYVCVTILTLPPARGGSSTAKKKSEVQRRTSIQKNSINLQEDCQKAPAWAFAPSLKRQLQIS